VIGFTVPSGGGNEKQEHKELPVGPQYLLRLDIAFEVARNSGSGHVEISGEVNGSEGEEVGIDINRGPTGQIDASWGTNDQIAGIRSGKALERKAKVNVVNYLPFDSVKAGENRMTFKMKEFGAARLVRATVLSNSGIAITPLNPARLKLDSQPSVDEPVVGEPLQIGFELKNIGNRAAHEVVVTLTPLSKNVKVVGRQEYIRKNLKNHEAGTFFVVPKRVGEIRLRLSAASSNTNKPGVWLKGNVTLRKAANAAVSPWLLGFIIVIGGTLVRGIWRRRHTVG
jgi:hypothetical protein